MRQLLYVSNTSRNFASAALQEILAVSRLNNATAGITGILLHMDGAFLQVLEGDDTPITQTYARICADTRHWDTRVLLDQHVGARAFGQWSMGFERLERSGVDAGQAFRISQDAVIARLESGAPIEIVTLLRTFQRVHDGQTVSG